MESYKVMIDAVRDWGKSSPLSVGTEVFVDAGGGRVEKTKIVSVLVTESGVKFQLAKNSAYFTALSALGKRVFFNEEDLVLSWCSEATDGKL